MGLAFLAIAALAAFTFLDPTAYSSTGAPGASQGLPPPTRPPATPEPTATPVTQPLPLPESWFVTFFAYDDAGEEQFFSRATRAEVDLAFEGPPVGSLADDRWGVLAETPVSLPAGRYVLHLRYDGEVEVLLNGSAIASADDGEGENTLSPVFDHPGGSLVIGVHGRDSGGPFVLRIEAD